MIDFYQEAEFLKKNNTIPERAKPTDFCTKSGSMHPDANKFTYVNIYTQLMLFLLCSMQTYYQWQNGREDLWGGSEFDQHV